MESSKKFECNLCNFAFSCQTALDRHMRTHSGEKPYSCSICGKSFSLKSNCRRHEATHSSEKRFECDICVMRFKAKESLTKHMRMHSGKNLFTCSICDKKFTQSSHLKRHERAHAGVKAFECPTCSKCFSTDYSLRMHQSVHENTEKTCDICSKTFNHLGSFKRHVRRHTSVSKTFECPICGKTFTANCYLQTHLQVHTGEKPFQCKECDKVFARKSSLKEHSLSHGKIKPHRCPECSKRFIWKNSLRNHMKQHSGEVYCCTQCDKTYTNKQGLSMHMKTHSEKSVRCIDCLQKFYNLRDFKRHHQTRACVAKAFQCYFCDKVFLKKASAILHMIEAHAEDNGTKVLSHNIEKPFKCCLCKKNFLSAQSRLLHEMCFHKLVEDLDTNKLVGQPRPTDIIEYNSNKLFENLPHEESSGVQTGPCILNDDKESEDLFVECNVVCKDEILSEDENSQENLQSDSLDDSIMCRESSDETSFDNVSKSQIKHGGNYIDEESTFADCDAFHNVHGDDKGRENLNPQYNAVIQEETLGDNINTDETKSIKNILEYDCNEDGKTTLAGKYARTEKLITCKEETKERIANCLRMYKNTLECSVCSKKFNSNIGLQCHMRVHIGEKPFWCIVCDETFMSKSSLRIHIFSHEKEKASKYCKSSLRNHKHVHAGHLLHCVKCDRKFANKSVLSQHMKRHADEPIRCLNCLRTFSCTSALRVHQKNRACHVKKFRCSLCGRVFVRKVDVIRHVKSTHLSYKEEGSVDCLFADLERCFQCSVCKRYFSNEQSYVWHEVSIHKLVEEVDYQDEDQDLFDESIDSYCESDMSEGKESNHSEKYSENVIIKEEIVEFGLPNITNSLDQESSENEADP